jgi:hypothetical protein
MAEVYGASCIETAADKLYDLIVALKDTMATGYDPTFSYVHQKHNMICTGLNAVTIELESATLESTGVSSSGKANQAQMTFTIRVHTDYQGIGAVRDAQKNWRLLNSILNKISANINLDDGYFILEMTNILPNEEFAESYTVGGQMSVQVIKNNVNTQE